MSKVVDYIPEPPTEGEFTFTGHKGYKLHNRRVYVRRWIDESGEPHYNIDLYSLKGRDISQLKFGISEEAMKCLVHAYLRLNNYERVRIDSEIMALLPANKGDANE